MNRLAKQVILWAVIIIIIAYLFNINPAQIVNDIVHAAQTVHNSHH